MYVKVFSNLISPPAGLTVFMSVKLALVVTAQHSTDTVAYISQRPLGAARGRSACCRFCALPFSLLQEKERVRSR